MAKKSVVTGNTRNPAPNVSGGLGVQAANMPGYLTRPTAATNKNVSTAARDAFYGGATVPRQNIRGGLGVTALQGVRKGPTANAPKATVRGVKIAPANAAAPIKARVKPAETIRTFVREKLTPTRKTGPQMALNRVTGNTTGFTSGTTTGKTISKAGVATKTPMSASRRAEQNAFNKGGVAGPSRGGGGGMGKSSGGASRSTGGGNTGRGDVGAGRRGGR